MTESMISVRGISKQYRIGARSDGGYTTLREALVEVAAAPLRRMRSFGRSSDRAEDSIWALRDVSFDLREGEVLGIIGRNGAGKSTLLRILAQITEPTQGEVILRGRVGALLEVGTGFHPELTGRENIFLSGAILGMRRTEIQSRFAEIVDFSGVEAFLDTPVKRYSTGMRVRLGFAVAAHLEHEILLVDEVLAVGDAAFQKKCLRKIERVGSGGRTVCFVSHDLPSVARLCPNALLLDQGEVIRRGTTPDVIHEYLNIGVGGMASWTWPEGEEPGNEIVRLLSVQILDHRGEVASTIDIRHPVSVEMTFEVFESGRVLAPNVQFHDDAGNHLFTSHDCSAEWADAPKPAGRYRSMVTVEGNFFAETTVIVGAAVTQFSPFVVHAEDHDVVAFQVVDSMEGENARGGYAGPMPGLIRPLLPWSTARSVDVVRKDE